MKNQRLEIRLSQADKETAKDLSVRLLGINNISKLFTKMLYEAANNSPILSDEQMIDFRMAVSQLSGIARNLNQITRRINSVDVITQDTLSITYLDSIKNYIDDVNKQMKKIVKDNS